MRSLMARLPEIAACPDCQIVKRERFNEVQICHACRARFEAETTCSYCDGSGEGGGHPMIRSACSACEGTGERSSA